MSLEQSIQNIIDKKTKPPGSLGLLERIAKQICLIQKSASPSLIKPHIIVFAADHGLAEQGISAYPQEVTGQMVLNFVAGGAAINAFSKQHNIGLTVADVGVNCEFEYTLPIKHLKAGLGTKDSSQGCAMTLDQLEACKQNAKDLVHELHKNGSNVIGFGEMGIGNTSSATLILHLLSGTSIEDCVGRGTGLDDEGMSRKLSILKKVARRHEDAKTTDEILLAVGGYEIASIMTAMQEAARLEMVVLVDGFIASAAAMLTCKNEPMARKCMIFCHRSAEAGHARMLELMQAEAILDLELRLGEGTGCALAYPLIESSLAFLNEMASFESAAISDKTAEQQP